MLSQMRITYCTTCYNRFWQLNQTLRQNLEMVKDDDGCDFVLVDFNGDDSEQISGWILDNFKDEIKSGKLKYYVRKEKKFKWNVAVAKNVATMLSVGDIVVNLDCDNFIQKDDAKIIREKFLEDPNIIIQMSQYNKNSIQFLRQYGIPVDKQYEHMQQDEVGDVGRMAIPKKILIELGGYDEQFDFMGYEDTDLMIRLCKSGLKYVYIPPSKHNGITNIPNPYNEETKNIWWGTFLKNKSIGHNNIINGQLAANSRGLKEDLFNYKLV